MRLIKPSFEILTPIDRSQILKAIYPEKDLAIKARKEAEVKYKFHKNHGNKRPVSE